MRIRPTLLVLFGLSIHAAAQTQAVKDPQALAVLSQVAAVSGWGTTIVTDAVASGWVTVEKTSGVETYPVIVKARPGHQVRTEFSTRGSIIVVNGQLGMRVTSAGTEHIQAFATYSMNPLMFPFFTILAEYASPNMALADLGTETVGTETAYRVELQRLSNVGDGLDQARNRAFRWVVSVSSTSLLPLKVEFEAISFDNPTSAERLVCYLSDFRKVGSLVVPFHLEEFASGQRLWSLQLDSVQVNVGLADSDFAIE